MIHFLKITSLYIPLCFCFFIMACEPPIIGNGIPTLKEKKLPGFNAVLCDVAGNLEIVASPNADNGCSITAQPNILPFITTEIVKNELIISLQQGVHIKSYDSVKIQVHTNTLNSVKLLGSTKVQILDSILEPHPMMCSIMGSGELNLLDGNYTNLRLQNSGSGTIFAQQCKAQSAEIGMKGSGSIIAGSTASRSVQAIVNGTGKIETFATDSIFAETTDAGIIEYKGTPKYTKIKAGKVGIVKNMQ
jgi:hypothetical protein